MPTLISTGKRCFGIRGLECCFSLIGVGFPNLGIRFFGSGNWVRKMEFHELALAFMKCRSAPDIGRVCVWMQETTGPPSNGSLFGPAYCPAHGNQAGGLFFPLRT